MKIKERRFTGTFYLRNNKGDLKGFQKTFGTFFFICHDLSIRERVGKKRKYTFEWTTVQVVSVAKTQAE